MSPGFGKCNKISHIVRIRQMLKRWRRKAASSSSVPAGHVAIYVGSSRRRFVVRATYLNHPIFQKLLIEAEEEYGFANQGPLSIPCEESLFEEILRFVSRAESGNSAARYISMEDFQRCCHVGFRKTNLEGFGESRPLLGSYAADKTVC